MKKFKKSNLKWFLVVNTKQIIHLCYKKVVDKKKKFVYYGYTEKTKEEKKEKMGRTTNESLEVVKKRELHFNK